MDPSCCITDNCASLGFAKPLSSSQLVYPVTPTSPANLKVPEARNTMLPTTASDAASLEAGEAAAQATQEQPRSARRFETVIVSLFLVQIVLWVLVLVVLLA